MINLTVDGQTAGKETEEEGSPDEVAASCVASFVVWHEA